MKIAIVHDYLIQFGGAERVLLALHEIYPTAPIYVSIYRKEKLGNFAHFFRNAEIIESWFGKLPFADKLVSPLRFLVPLIWQSFDLKKYDLIISSASWAVTKGFDKKPGATEICYCHTPPRYLYGYDTSRRFKGFFGGLVKIYGRAVNGFMRRYDFSHAQKVDYFIANSREIAGRIAKFYKRDATVIYPPVEIPKSEKSLEKKGAYFLTGARLTAAKNFDLIIEAFNKINLPLLVYGKGPQERYLKSLAKANMAFLGEVTDEEITNLYKNARGYIVAQKDEDFGVTPVEAMGQGTPVIAYKGGGYLESVVEGKTGIFFPPLRGETLRDNDSEGYRDGPRVEDLIEAVRRFEKMKFKSEACVTQAKKFSKERFKSEMLQFIKTHAQDRNKNQ
jgi:glycosyltransferase involved in cell wall biosynthesis